MKEGDIALEAKKIEEEFIEERKAQPKREIQATRTFDLNSASLEYGESDALSYLLAVRNRINTYVHRNYDPSMGRGEVQLHFILNSNGGVKSVSILRESGEIDRRLRDFCLDSIHRSAPFDPFPGGLNLPRAAFNISISFKR